MCITPACQQDHAGVLCFRKVDLRTQDLRISIPATFFDLRAAIESKFSYPFPNASFRYPGVDADHLEDLIPWRGRGLLAPYPISDQGVDRSNPGESEHRRYQSGCDSGVVRLDEVALCDGRVGDS